MHEVRRPLQALVLLEGAGGAGRTSEPGRSDDAARRGLLELARSALASLDGEVNGDPAPTLRREVSCRELVCAALERWRQAAEGVGGVKLFWDAGPAPVIADPTRLAQALDNLLANAIEHGRSPVVVTGASVAGRLRITVANGAAPTGERSQPDGGDGGRDDPRHGHGLPVVSQVAGEHNGRFALCRTGSGCVAALEVPLTDGSLALAA
jgi:two-component system, OmpR family, sensor kinase